MTQEQEIQLSKILINIEWDIWSTQLTILTLENLINSITIFRQNDLEHFYSHFDRLYTTIRNTRPRIWMIIHYMSQIYDIIQDWKWRYKTIDDIYKELNKFLKNTKKEIENDTCTIIWNWAKLISDNDTVFVHSPSWIVKQVLKRAARNGTKFKVILAQQSEEKTNNMIYFLQNNNIDFLVTPEFMLSNIEWKIDKMLVWGITFNSERQFIVSAWVNAAVSEIHLAKKPIYMFLSTKKFSLWKSEAHKDHTIYKTKEITSADSRLDTYQRVKFSHDRVDAKLFNIIMTECWELNYEKICNLYEKRFADKVEWRKKHKFT